ncbi:Protein N-acetyltransferase, RimJ/RimL family [Lentibacillus halodurans]|uniref:Protein N-acetyltransferase, RimJ/RimL family n=1 Tax=Lentibacillus halodurans TaxID=237679 RepID=A0A1I0X180_9BACI|nr:GNAT family N-acetyltransferase [Lentibacillus halodurans]SFA94769.1 Protein N-acetyltransferase, RimJ/RimL family [Lentibacillus halodurans]
MIIRPIEINDAEEFLELNRRIDESGFMLHEPGERKTTVEQQKQAIERISFEERSALFVAELDKSLAGFIAVFGGKMKRDQHSAYLALGVHDAFHGRGIATKLIKYVFEWAEETGISRLELTVIKDNVKAINLYEKMGFRVEGEKVHSLMIDGSPANEYYMYKLV